MPLFYTHNINESARLAVWHITEPEDFFKKIYIPVREISHPHKRLQHLAGRFLLQILDPAFPVNDIRLDGRRPYLPDNSWYFSISHCGDFAAAILSRKCPVGIDVELVTEKLDLLEKKFLNENEQQIIRNSDSVMTLRQRLTSFWSAKESMFKWYAIGNVDFRKDMVIHNFSMNKSVGEINAVFGKQLNKRCNIQFRFFDELCLAWLANDIET